MRVGTLVKWLNNASDYGELGIVIDVFPNGNFRVAWASGTYAQHGSNTELVEVLCS
jgi:hypothetical protein